MHSTLRVILPSLQLHLFPYRGKTSADASKDGSIKKHFAVFLNLSSTFFPSTSVGASTDKRQGFGSTHFFSIVRSLIVAHLSTLTYVRREPNPQTLPIDSTKNASVCFTCGNSWWQSSNFYAVLMVMPLLKYLCCSVPHSKAAALENQDLHSHTSQLSSQSTSVRLEPT